MESTKILEGESAEPKKRKRNTNLPYYKRRACKGFSLATIGEIRTTSDMIADAFDAIGPCIRTCAPFCWQVGRSENCEEARWMLEKSLTDTLYKRVSENGYEIPKLLDSPVEIDKQTKQVAAMEREAYEVIGCLEKLIKELEDYEEDLTSDDMWYNYDEMALDVGSIRGRITFLDLRIQCGLMRMSREFDM
jgi:hypothetical protein